MNNSDLIDELREGMRVQTDRTEIPDGFADQARRTAQRRSARRAGTVGPPLLAAAGVAIVLATTAGSHSSAPRVVQAVHGTVGTEQTHDTAYVLGRVRAHLADLGQSDVLETVETGGNGSPGSDVTVPSWSYTDPQSDDYYSSTQMLSPTGTNIYDQYIVGTPNADDSMSYQSTNLDPVQQLYAITTSVGPNDPAPDVAQASQQIKSELNNGQATEDGTAIIDGQPTIKLTSPETDGHTNTLYVNAQTYAPVQSVSVWVNNAQNPTDDTDTTTENWLPATAANIANTQLDQIPAGDTQVSQNELEKANPAGR